MGIRKNKTTLIRAVSELQDADYSKEPELHNIYQRLSKGRQQLAEVFEKNIKAVMQISSLDLTMQHETDKIVDISRNIAQATESIFGVSAGNQEFSGAVNSQHEELSSTIVDVATDIEEVYQKIEACQGELTGIKELSQQTIDISRKMQRDMDELFEVINRMNEVIAGIDSISLQTNLLAINASIEAARAGEAGRGFAVVANEIRDLAEETQKLTGNMSSFVESIKTASQQSIGSATETIDALGTMTSKISNVWELNNENQTYVSKVNESISSIAAVSEELSSSMDEMENQLKDSTVFMRNVSEELIKATEPVVDIEKTLDDTVKQIGLMTEDDFFHMENAEFAKHVSSAITAHQTWLRNLENMVKNRSIVPLQLDSTKCGFGHFYHALTPKIPGVRPIWDSLGQKHERFHKFGSEAIYALNTGRTAEAEQIYREAEAYSKGLLSDLEKMLQLSKG